PTDLRRANPPFSRQIAVREIITSAHGPIRQDNGEIKIAPQPPATAGREPAASEAISEITKQLAFNEPAYGQHQAKTGQPTKRSSPCTFPLKMFTQLLVVREIPNHITNAADEPNRQIEITHPRSGRR